MSDRSIRRAAERAAKKAAVKAAKANEAAKTMTASAGNNNTTTPTWDSWDGWDNDDPPPPYPGENGEEDKSRKPISDAKLSANRQNAQKSTGAKTQSGQEKSKMNALSHGLCSQAALLPSEDPIVYQAFIESIFSQWSPATDQESRLTEVIGTTEWRLRRIPGLEAGIYAVGLLEHNNLFLDEPDSIKRDRNVQSKLYLIYEKQFKNLSLQERRLRSQHKADVTELKQLQQDRLEKAKQAEQALKEEREANVKRAEKISANCYKLNKPFRPADFGFDFTAEEYDHFLNLQEAQYEFTGEALDLYKVLEAYRNAKKVA
jgi:predicted ribosome quality control (RQC) complex YloA/Tae2 family protein